MLPQPIAREALLTEVEDIIRTAPDTVQMGNIENVDWLGRAAAVVDEWGKGAQWAVIASNLGSPVEQFSRDAPRQVMALLHQARHDLRMRTVGPVSGAFERGRVFDYFDELRKVIDGAQEDLLFVDPYLDAEFASRYLPHVRQKVLVRLLTTGRHVEALLSSVVLLQQQQGLNVNIRVGDGLHDRHLFVDRRACYHSGASFKDGAKRAPTTLHQITDVFAEVYAAYEIKWATGQPVS